MKKRVLSLVVVLAMTVIILPFGSVVASAASPSIGFAVNDVATNGVTATATIDNVDITEWTYTATVTVDFSGTTNKDSIFVVSVETPSFISHPDWIWEASFKSLAGNDRFEPVTFDMYMLVDPERTQNTDDLELVFESIDIPAEPMSSITWQAGTMEQQVIESGAIDIEQALSPEGQTVILPASMTRVAIKLKTAAPGIGAVPDSDSMLGMGGPDEEPLTYFQSMWFEMQFQDGQVVPRDSIPLCYYAKVGDEVLETYRFTFTLATSGTTLPPKGNNNSSSSDRDSGSSGNSSNTKSSAPANTPVTVTQAAVNSAVAAARSSGNTSVNLRNPGEISLAILRSIKMPLQADSLSADNRTVDVRITLDPALAKNGLNLSASTMNAQAINTTNRFKKHFSNDIMTVALGQQGSFGQEVRIAAKINPNLNTANLVFYSYDRTTNTYKIIHNTDYRIDSNGYVHFNTTLAGDIIISDGALTRR